MSVPVGSYMVGMGAPYVLPYRCDKRAGDTWDPLAVTGATMELRDPNGVVKPVVVTVSNISAAGVTVERALAEADLDVAGSWVCTPRLTIPSGTVLCDPVAFYVRGKFEP